jgi:AhpC/TSA family.
MMVISIASYCQQADDVPAYKKTQDFPEFSVVTPDSVWVTNQSLPANKPIIFIYFSPDCGHCQIEAQEIYKMIDSFRNVTFLWVSYHPLTEIQEFKTKYLNGLPNVIFARDPKYFFPTFYKVAFTPYIAVYNAKRLFVNEFRQGAKPEELIQSLH